MASSLSLPSPLVARHLVLFPNRHLDVPRAATFFVNCSDHSISISTGTTNINPPVAKKRKRYRKLYPGEAEGITQEMRFVAMRLRNVDGKYVLKKNANRGGESGAGDSESKTEEEEEEGEVKERGGEEDGGGGTWNPSLEGFVKYLVDSKVVFETIERIVDESSDVAYAYFRRTGLERTERLSKDLEWFSSQGVALPLPGNPGTSYSKYLEELAEKSAPLFLSHFYNVYFSHIAGGQVIVSQVSDKILDGRELEFCKWDGDVEMLLKGVRENLNMLSEHWARHEKNKCLKETTKSFHYMGQIVRLIIL
ncbi:hypothetical protein MLD38_022298 [Melastoma candidum]|uniref:Uncharacterized protein n=1 Tax=Melastoma candidum TaxID=119954 RepID=A0ACB9QKM5_9MYRT|nr:hypothetical protein MLD38_022298 [Melastoma candidum]